jgi:hypothetical protein
MSEKPTENAALQLIHWITDRAIDGIPPLCSAQNLALEYEIDASYPDTEERIESLINWETSKNFTSGFITGLVGIVIRSMPREKGSGASCAIVPLYIDPCYAREVSGGLCILEHDARFHLHATFVIIECVSRFSFFSPPSSPLTRRWISLTRSCRSCGSTARSAMRGTRRRAGSPSMTGRRCWRAVRTGRWSLRARRA